jgi:hypothetical protein
MNDIVVVGALVREDGANITRHECDDLESTWRTWLNMKGYDYDGLFGIRSGQDQEQAKMQIQIATDTHA